MKKFIQRTACICIRKSVNLLQILGVLKPHAMLPFNLLHLLAKQTLAELIIGFR